MIINVIGATGNLGSRVIDALLKQGAAPETLIASVRNPEKARPLAEKGVSVRLADYEDRESLVEAFADTDVLLLIPSSAAVEPRILQHHNAVTAAIEAGVQRIVFASFEAAEPTSQFLVAPFMLYAESTIRQSGLDWTICRDGMYLDPIADWMPQLIRMEKLPYPVKQGQVAYISRDDLARALAAACLSDEHNRKLYHLTGAHALSMTELADIITRVAGRTVAFDSVSEETFADICREDDVPERMIEILISMYRAVDNGEFSLVTTDVERLTGNPAEDAESYLRRVLGSEFIAN